MVEIAETSNFDEFEGKDCVFVVNWLKTKGLHKLCSVFEGVQDRFIFIPEVMKTGLANLTFCVIFHNFSCVILACLCLVTADFGFFVCLFFAVFQLGICVEIEVDIITIPPPHSSPPLCFCPYPQFSL